MKKLWLFLFAFIPFSVKAIGASSYIVMDQDSGRVLSSRCRSGQGRSPYGNRRPELRAQDSTILQRRRLRDNLYPAYLLHHARF